MNLGEMLEIIRPWWTATAATGAFGFASRFYLKWRRQSMDALSEDRQGWLELIEAMRADVKGVREDLAAVRIEQQSERQECALQLERMAEKIRALTKQLLAHSINSGIKMGGLSPAMQAAIDSVTEQVLLMDD